jgi:hypothetical protein
LVRVNPSHRRFGENALQNSKHPPVPDDGSPNLVVPGESGIASAVRERVKFVFPVMSESTKLDRASDTTASSASLKEVQLQEQERERIVSEEGDMAAVGDIEAARERGMDDDEEKETEEAVDPYLVSWKGSDDPENPLNFSTRRKASLMVMVAAIAFLT